MKFIAFPLEIVCFRDVSLDAIFGQFGGTLDQLLPQLGGVLGANVDQLDTNLHQHGADLGQLAPNFGQLNFILHQLGLI